MSKQEHRQMTAERAIELLSSGAQMPAVPHTAAELDEACRMACESLRWHHDLAAKKARVENQAIAYHFRNIGVSIDRLDKLADADRAGRLVILPDASCTDTAGEEALRKAMWHCDQKNNDVTRFAADVIIEKLLREMNSRMSVATPLGDIVVEADTDSENPGVWVSFHRFGEEYEPTLALIEFTADESDQEKPAIITRVWRDAEQDEYTDRIVHTGLEKSGIG